MLLTIYYNLNMNLKLVIDKVQCIVSIIFNMIMMLVRLIVLLKHERQPLHQYNMSIIVNNVADINL